MIKLYRTLSQPLVEIDSEWYSILNLSWDDVFNQYHLTDFLTNDKSGKVHLEACSAPESGAIRAPVGEQEIWAAGVTYLRSKSARMAESKKAGAGNFYDRVYEAERPELFYKGSRRNAVGDGDSVRIRRDSKWNVPEPELTLAINSEGVLIGFTVGNDMSSRDIEGENPLYLPQAKIYDRSCALGPGILLQDNLPQNTVIEMSIIRHGDEAFAGQTYLGNIKRSFDELIEYLYRENSFPSGCFLMTGTGIIPPDSFTLEKGDEVRITIEQISTLTNTVE